jgi:Protein of unknown function (DUF4239)
VTALLISLVTFALIFGGASLGMYFRNALSEDHFSEDVRDVIKLSTGLIGTIAALVLGLLIASAKSSYDTKSTQIKQITTNIILLDLDLERYGPDAKNLRLALREAISPLIDRIWNEGDRTRVSPFAASVQAGEFFQKIQLLQPNNERERAFHAQVLSAAANVEQVRLSLFTQSNDAIPAPFLLILIFWLAIIFTSFGLFVRPNRIAIVTFIVGGISVASAIFLILEMGQPFTGLMQISSEAPRHALAPLGPALRERMSAISPKRAFAIAPHMSAFGGRADMTLRGNPLSRSLLGVKRT